MAGSADGRIGARGINSMGKLRNRIPELIQLKGIRDNKRYTQKEMARGCGLSEGAISRIMRYETIDNVPFGHALIVAQWLEVPMEELVREE
jgi:transcriptional regulator with XRE-family HTH domain